jgi:hypothetical protein
MKRLFLIGLIAGFVGTLAAARFLPWVNHVRVPSQTTVVANGGRSERFEILLPSDRIHAAGAADALRRATALPALAASADDALLVEHFKVRDAAGTVIGVAARHWAMPGGQPQTTWLLAIPSRGALLLTGHGEAEDRLATALASNGYRPGASWEGELNVVTTPDDADAHSPGGSREFGGLEVRYTEAWNITGISADGEMRGTIQLDTISRHGG